MNSNEGNVVRMDSQINATNELENLIQSLNVLNWELQIQTIIMATGLPVGDLLSDRKTFIPGGSMASRAGHGTIESFICGNKEEGGLGWAWTKWDTLSTAIRYKNFYSIYVEDPKEIIAQYNDICKILDRAPVNAAEYHSAKDSHLVMQRTSLIEQHNREKIDLESQVKSTELMLGISKGNETTLRKELSDLDTIYKGALADTDIQISKARTELNTEKENALIAQRQEIESQWSEKINTIENTAKIRIEEAKESASQTKDFYSSKNFVPVSDFNELEGKFQSEKNTVQDLLIRLTDSQSEARLISSENDEKSIRITNLEKTISEQSKLIEALHNGLSNGNLSELNSKELTDMKNTIAALEGYIDRYRKSSLKWKGKFEDSSDKIKLMDLQIKDLKLEMKKASSQKSYQSFATWFFGVTTVALSIFSAINYFN